METRRDFLIGCVASLFGLMLYLVIIPLSVQQMDASCFRAGEVSPAFFPRVIAIGIMICGAAMALLSLINLLRERTKATRIALSKVSISSLVITSIGMFLYVRLIKGIGYLEATIVIAFVAFWLLGYKRWYVVIWALGMAAATYVLFGRIIRVPLPEGIISEKLWF